MTLYVILSFGCSGAAPNRGQAKDGGGIAVVGAGGIYRPISNGLMEAKMCMILRESARAHIAIAMYLVVKIHILYAVLLICLKI